MTITVLFLGKIFAIIALSLYIIFAVVVVKQVGLMTRTIEVGLEGLIKLVAWAHLIFAITVLVIAIAIL